MQSILDRINSYNDAIAKKTETLTAADAALRGTAPHVASDLTNIRAFYRAMDREAWRAFAQTNVAPLMAEINAQAKLVYGLARIGQYHQTNRVGAGNEPLFDYTRVVSMRTAYLLHALEHLNFTVFMGKSDAAWVAGGEGLFFALYFSESTGRFNVGVLPRAVVAVAGETDDDLARRSAARAAKFDEMYPPLSANRSNADAEAAAFLSAAAIVASVSAVYKMYYSKRWASATTQIKHVCESNSTDIDAIPFSELRKKLGRLVKPDEIEIENLQYFYVECFELARTCPALHVDLMNDRRLPSIARVLAAFNIVQEDCSECVYMPEWLLALAYKSESKLMTDVRDALVEHTGFQIVIYRSLDFFKTHVTEKYRSTLSLAKLLTTVA